MMGINDEGRTAVLPFVRRCPHLFEVIDREDGYAICKGCGNIREAESEDLTDAEMRDRRDLRLQLENEHE